MKEPKPKNPYKSSGQRDSDVSKEPFPITTSSQLQSILSDQGNEKEWNMEVRGLCLGITYLKQARIQLGSVPRYWDKPNHEYEDRVKEVIDLIRQIEERWPLVVR